MRTERNFPAHVQRLHIAPEVCHEVLASFLQFCDHTCAESQLHTIPSYFGYASTYPTPALISTELPILLSMVF